MAGFKENRKYKRCSCAVCKVKISENGKTWTEIETCDVSARGLGFQSKTVYKVGSTFKFDLFVYNAFSEFNFKFDGKIVHCRKNGETFKYGVEFIGADKGSLIQLDEIIRTEVSIADKVSNSHHAYEEGTYTFMLRPKKKSSKVL